MTLRANLLRTIALLALFSAASEASAVETSTVSYPSGTDTVSAFLAKPDGPGPFPAVIVIHEWWGLNDQIKETAKKLAGEGYVALGVDLYRGRAAASRDEAHELMRGLPEDRAVRDLQAAVAYLSGRKDVRAKRIGSIGWCMGGGYSLSLAVNSPQLAACVIYYGRLLTDAATLGKVASPVIGFFGEEDRGIPVSDVQAFEKQMKALGKSVEIHIYPGAGHAFFNEERPSYRAAAAKDAWQKTLAFFAAHLKP